MQPYCIYCRKSRVSHYHYVNRFFRSEQIFRNEPPNDIFKCPACGVLCTQSELDRDMENRKAYSGSADGSLPENRQAEEQALSAAWKLMQSRRWDEALNELFPQGFALTQPLVFLIYRGVCQTAPLLVCRAEELEHRYQHIYILLNNIKCINSYQGETNDSEADYMAFKRLTDALLLLGSLPVLLHKNRVSEGPVYYTNYTRASVLVSLADILEMSTVGNIKYGAEYLKMAVQLLHQSLISTQEKKKFLPYYECFLNIPKEDRRQICGKINKLNSDIRLLDPGFTPIKPLPGPRVYTPLQVKLINNAGWLGLSLILSQIAAFILIYYCDMKEKGIARIDTYNVFKESCWFNAGFWLIIITITASEKDRERERTEQYQQVSEKQRRSLPLTKQPAGNTASAAKRTCLYCGKKTLAVPAELFRSRPDLILDASPDENGSVKVLTDYYYKCGSCGVCCSKSEVKKAAAAAKDGSSASKPEHRSETELLSWVWELIQVHKWDKALELLYQPSYPFEYPFEFTFCRKICQAALLLDIPNGLSNALSFSTFSIAKCLKQRYEVLDPLAESLNCLNYYLSDADGRSAFLRLRRLYEILLLFNGLPFKDLSAHIDKQQINDYTHKKRLEISVKFASLSTDRADRDPERRAAYLDMAAELLRSCSRVTLTVKGALQQLTLTQYVNQYSQISRYERELLDEKIEKLTAALGSCGPDHAPGELFRPDDAIDSGAAADCI